jgi:hypothetical protein
MKITSARAIAALLLINSITAWKLTLHGKGNKTIIKNVSWAIDADMCQKFEKHDFKTTKVSYNPAPVGNFAFNFAHFTIFESDNCVTGDGYAWLKQESFPRMVTLKLRTPFKAKSYLLKKDRYYQGT